MLFRSKTYEIDAELVEKIKTDDIALMFFSFDYLANTLFGAQTEIMKIREDKIREKIVEIKARQDEAVISALKEYEELKKDRGNGG